MKNIARNTLILLCTVMLLSGCQPTPEKSAVIGKAGDYLDTDKETPFKPYEAPSSVQESDNISGLNLTFDAKVTVPKTDGYSVMEVSKEVFDADTLKKVMDYFNKNQSWVKEPALTKEEIIKEIAYYKTNGDPESPSVKKTIQDLQDQLKDAPDKAIDEPFSFDSISNGKNCSAYFHNQDNGTFSVLTGKLNGNSYQYCRDSDEYWVSEDNAETDQEKNDLQSMNPGIPVEEAQKEAEKAKGDLNADPAMLLSSHTKSIFYKNDKAVSAGWEFCFMRDCNGLQASYVSDWDTWKGSAAPVNAAPWGHEFMFIIVDDKGIAMYYTSGAGRQKSVLFKNVKLMAFNDILERAKKQLVYNHAYLAKNDEEHSVKVNDIALRSSLVNIKDRPGFGRLIPTWDISYDYHERFKGKQEATVYHCHLYLNAIDGSYIEPRTTLDSISN